MRGDTDGGGRLGNLMRSFRDSVVSWRARMGWAEVGSTLMTSCALSSPSLSSSMMSACGGKERARDGREIVGLVGGGERTGGAGRWLGV